MSSDSSARHWPAGAANPNLELLNDLFGIQARGGCSRAGPYGHRLLADYRFNPRSGHWRHRDAPPDPVLSLPDLLDGRSGPGPVTGGDDLPGHLELARVLLGAAAPVAPEAAGPSWLPPEVERLRDFHLPAT